MLTDKQKEALRRSYYKHREERIARMKDYYKTHSDELKEYFKDYYKDHKEEYKEYHEHYYAEHKEELIQHVKTKYRTDAEFRRKATEATMRYYNKKKSKIERN